MAGPPTTDARNQLGGVSPDGRIAAHIPCIACGYDLNGQAVSGACPECGRAAADSVRGDRLEFADAKWLAGLAAGAKWLAITSGAGATLMIVYSVSLQLPDPYSDTGWLVKEVAVDIAILQIELFSLLAIWHLTRREPTEGDRTTKGALLRISARWSALAGVVVGPFLVAQAFAISDGSIATLSIVIVFGLQLVDMVSFAIVLAHLRRLMLRAPARGTALHLGVTAGCFAAIGLMHAIWWAQMISLTMGQMLFPDPGALMVIGIAARVGGWILYLWSIVLLFRCAKLFRTAHRAAEANAAAGIIPGAATITPPAALHTDTSR